MTPRPVKDAKTEDLSGLTRERLEEIVRAINVGFWEQVWNNEALAAELDAVKKDRDRLRSRLQAMGRKAFWESKQ